MQFRIDDNKLVWYVSQNIERIFCPPDAMHQPTFLPKEFYYGNA